MWSRVAERWGPGSFRPRRRRTAAAFRACRSGRLRRSGTPGRGTVIGRAANRGKRLCAARPAVVDDHLAERRTAAAKGSDKGGMGRGHSLRGGGPVSCGNVN